MGDWNHLWDEHSRLMDRMMDAAQKEFVRVDQPDMCTVRIHLTLVMLFDLLLGRTLRFRTDKTGIILTRK